MKSLKNVFFVLIFCLVFPLAAFAEEAPKVMGTDVTKSATTPDKAGEVPGMAHGMMNGTMPGPGEMPGMHGMMMGQGMPYSDKAFLSGMIPHHEAAVEMAKDVLQKGKDPQVKAWAQAVIKSQEAEITQMRGWLKNMGGEDAGAAGEMRGAMKSMMSMPSTGDVDRDFVTMMIPHHAGAVHMSARALVGSDNDNILTLAKQIIDAQTSEILEFKQWLKKGAK